MKNNKHKTELEKAGDLMLEVAKIQDNKERRHIHEQLQKSSQTSFDQMRESVSKLVVGVVSFIAIAIFVAFVVGVFVS